MPKTMRFKEAPNKSWTSLIGSSPGRVLLGRQSHINQKSKEAWCYEHLPVLTSIDWFLLTKICYWTVHAWCLCCSVAIFFEFKCSKYTDWCFNVHQVRTRPTPFTGKKETSVFWNMRQLTVKKRNDTLLTHKAKLKITVCPYVHSVCYVYLLIFIEWQAYLPFQRIGKIFLVCFKLVFTIYVYTPKKYNLVSPTDACSNVKHTTIILSYVPICFYLRQTNAKC